MLDLQVEFWSLSAILLSLLSCLDSWRDSHGNQHILSWFDFLVVLPGRMQRRLFCRFRCPAKRNLLWSSRKWINMLNLWFTVAGSSRGLSNSTLLKKTFPLLILHSILSKPGTLSLWMTPATKPSLPRIAEAAWLASSAIRALVTVSSPFASSCSEKNTWVFSKTCRNSVSSRKLDLRFTAFVDNSRMSFSVFSMCAWIYETPLREYSLKTNYIHIKTILYTVSPKYNPIFNF